MQDKIFEILFEQDEVTWQSMLYELIKQEGMNAWDIDVSLLSRQYIQMLKRMKELNFRISGKVVLAAALLLRIKSYKLVGEDMDELDRLMTSQPEEGVEGFYDDLERDLAFRPADEEYDLLPRSPQPRKRKVSIYDLVSSLSKALEVQERRVLRSIPAARVELPVKKIDMTSKIREVYQRIFDFFKLRKKLTFDELVPSDTREDKVYTFIPLLHLANQDQNKIELVQKEHFGEIEVVLKK
jgi:segregation and condensation protein A